MLPIIRSLLTGALRLGFGLGPRRSLTCDRRERFYHLVVPQRPKVGESLPAVIALHGATMNGPMMALMSGLNATAKAHRFLVAYPDGTGPGGAFVWNAGQCCGWAKEQGIDDVGFLTALIRELVLRHGADPRRIYACGVSNGGMMAYRLARERSESIAAIASIAGPAVSSGPEPTRPVPVLHFHGIADEFTPYKGGKGAKSVTGCDYPSVETTIQTWARFNRCALPPTRETVPMPARDLPTTRDRYLGTDREHEVVLYTIEGGGHTWPGRRPLANILGKSSLALNANEIMWDFFQQHLR